MADISTKTDLKAAAAAAPQSSASSDAPRGVEAAPAGDSPAQAHPTPVGDTQAQTQPAVAGDQGGATSAGEQGLTEDAVKLALRRVKDPEINLNIIDLGLVYGITIEGAKVTIDMSLTSPGCPSGPELLSNAEAEARSVSGVEDVVVNLVWTPMWSPDRMEPRIRAYLGF